MFILRGRKSVPGMNNSEREMERGYYSAFTNIWHGKIDYCIMKEGMFILRGRKSVPGINSRERGNGKKRTIRSSPELHDKELV
nr:hypothetical protein [Tanacetum cinerariifolium]